MSFLGGALLGSIAAKGPDLWQVWEPILFVYGITAGAFVVILPVLYGLVRFEKRLEYALGTMSAPPPITGAQLPTAVAELRRTIRHRGLVIAAVFDVFATAFAVLPVMAYVSQYQISPPVVALYVVVSLIAAAGGTALWIVPIAVTTYLAERANLQHRVQRTASPS